MLATKGVYGEQRRDPIATVRVRGEDSDHTVYELLDGEETPTVGKDGDAHPLGRTYVLKAGPEVTNPFGMGASSTPSPVVGVEQAIEDGLRETLELCTRDVQGSAPAPVLAESEDEGSFPTPDDSKVSEAPPGSAEWNSPEAMSMKIYRTMKFMAEKVEWESRPKPIWWSSSWDEIAEAREVNGIRIPTGSPCEFKECITDEVYALDEAVMELGVDASTGEQVDSSVNPELINVAAAVVWNARGPRRIRKCDRGADHSDLLLSLFEDALKLVPDSRSLAYVTHSDWLFEQWRDMLAWKSIGYQGLWSMWKRGSTR
jgi:hypothetical protein